MAGTTDDFPTVLGNEDEWGDMLTEFFARTFIMSGDKSGLLAVMTNEGQVMTNEGQVLVNIPGV